MAPTAFPSSNRQRLAVLARAALCAPDAALRQSAISEARALAAAALGAEASILASRLAALFASSGPLPDDTAILVSDLGAVLDRGSRDGG